MSTKSRLETGSSQFPPMPLPGGKEKSAFLSQELNISEDINKVKNSNLVFIALCLYNSIDLNVPICVICLI